MKRRHCVASIVALASTITFFNPRSAHAFMVPEGTYLRSCHEIRVEGPYLHALCERFDHTFRASRLFLPKCRGVEVGNQDGHLSCGG